MIDSIGRLDFRPFSQLDSTPPSNDRLNRSTRSISGSTTTTTTPLHQYILLHCGCG